jgi:hypothetical protein
MAKKMNENDKKSPDFSEELDGKNVRILLSISPELSITGKVIESRPYWLKVKVNKKIFYINKAYIIDLEILS